MKITTIKIRNILNTLPYLLKEIGPRPQPEATRFFPFRQTGFIIKTILLRISRKIFFDCFTLGLRYRMTLHFPILALLSAQLENRSGCF